MNQPNKQEKPRIGITIGDYNGIGPEVIIKALQDARVLSLLTPVIYGSAKVIAFYKKMLNIEDFSYTQVRNRGQFAHKNINVVNCWEDNNEVTPGKPSAEAGKAALASLRQACEDLKEGMLDALVTAPIDKHTIHSEEFQFKGHTEYLTKFFGAESSLMLLISENLRVGVVTEHVPISAVAGLITKERLEKKIQLMEQSLRKDFGINKPKVAVLGLNPHAGDEGLIGSEDQQIIKALVNDLRNKGKIVQGPLPADGFFGTQQFLKFDGVLAMYHDQGLVPFKTIAFDSGVNFTAGLPVVRTSPDHGTAYNIAGKGVAREDSMREAIYAACDILKRRASAI